MYEHDDFDTTHTVWSGIYQVGLTLILKKHHTNTFRGYSAYQWNTGNWKSTDIFINFGASLLSELTDLQNLAPSHRLLTMNQSIAICPSLVIYIKGLEVQPFWTYKPN